MAVYRTYYILQSGLLLLDGCLVWVRLLKFRCDYHPLTTKEMKYLKSDVSVKYNLLDTSSLGGVGGDDDAKKSPSADRFRVRTSLPSFVVARLSSILSYITGILLTLYSEPAHDRFMQHYRDCIRSTVLREYVAMQVCLRSEAPQLMPKRGHPPTTTLVAQSAHLYSFSSCNKTNRVADLCNTSRNSGPYPKVSKTTGTRCAYLIFAGIECRESPSPPEYTGPTIGHCIT